MFSLTPAAARQIQQAASGENLSLRIAARVDADGTVAYGMGFDDAKDDDMKLDIEGIAVVIAEEFQYVLNDIVLDFVELEPGEFNFIFADAALLESDTHNAQAAGGCSTAGCGGGGCGGGDGCGSTGRTH